MNTRVYISADSEYWDLIIIPQKSWFDLQLRQIWCYRDLLMLFVRRDVVAFYKQTILGPLWYFIQPIATTIVFTFVFGNLAGLSTDGVICLTISATTTSTSKLTI